MSIEGNHEDRMPKLRPLLSTSRLTVTVRDCTGRIQDISIPGTGPTGPELLWNEILGTLSLMQARREIVLLYPFRVIDIEVEE